MSNPVEPINRNWKTKAEIAGHFQMGVRTVSKLMRRKVLPFFKLRNLVRFDLGDCERAFESFKVPTRAVAVKARQLAEPTTRHWRTKRQIAAHMQLSERTATTLMRQRVLPSELMIRMACFSILWVAFFILFIR
jgi:DNA-binding CsgD family transcriptional regulator